MQVARNTQSFGLARVFGKQFPGGQQLPVQRGCLLPQFLFALGPVCCDHRKEMEKPQRDGAGDGQHQAGIAPMNQLTDGVQAYNTQQ